MGDHYVAGTSKSSAAIVFDADADRLRGCTGVFDRAALVALPRDMRAPHARHVKWPTVGSIPGLLVTLDYPQQEMAGPPFSVDDEEVQALYADHSLAELIYRRDILDMEPKFQKAGVSCSTRWRRTGCSGALDAACAIGGIGASLPEKPLGPDSGLGWICPQPAHHLDRDLTSGHATH